MSDDVRRDPPAAVPSRHRHRRAHRRVLPGARAVPRAGGSLARPSGARAHAAARISVRTTTGTRWTPDERVRTRAARGPVVERAGARTRSTSRPRCSRDCCTSASTSSVSTSASCTRASVSCSCTRGRTTRAAARAGRSTAATPRRSRRSPTGSRRSPRSRCTRPTRRRRARVRGRTCSASSRCCARATCSGRSTPRSAADPALARWATWLDQFGIDSAYDYDPVWADRPGARRVDRVPLGLHRAQPAPLDLELHVQPPRLARRGSALARQVVVPRRRHPPVPEHELRVPRRRRRVGRRALQRHHRALGEAQPRTRCAPSSIPRSSIATSCSSTSRRFAPDGDRTASCAARANPKTCSTSGPRAASSAPKTSRPCSSIRSTSVAKPTTRSRRTAFNTAINPFGARLHAMMGSDIAHWDVPDMTEVLEEAWEMVDARLDHARPTSRSSRSRIRCASTPARTPTTSRAPSSSGAVADFLAGDR